MSTAELSLRLVFGALFFLAGVALLWPAATRRHPFAARVVLVVGTTAIAFAVDWPVRGGRP